jgi:hypothetical protein
VELELGPRDGASEGCRLGVTRRWGANASTSSKARPAADTPISIVVDFDLPTFSRGIIPMLGAAAISAGC